MGIVRGQNGANCPLDDFFFIVCRNQYCHSRLVGRYFVRSSARLFAEAIEYGEGAYEQQAAGHQQVTEKKDSGNRLATEVPQSKPKPVEPCRPSLIGRDRWHYISLGLAHQIMKRDDCIALSADAGDDHG